MASADAVFCVLYLIMSVFLVITLWRLYLRVIDGIEKFNKSISEPCTEIAQGVRDVRQCAKTVSDETREFLKVEENRRELKRAVSGILILGIAMGISNSIQKVAGRSIKER